MFLSVIEKTAQTKCHLSPDQPLLVGVSGGADSLALMHALHQLGYSLVIAHLDHGLRPESAADADYVRQKAEELGLPFVSARMDVRAMAARDGLSLEEAARQVRYDFLFEQARQAGAQAVAVAHHADDQVETVLMHFLRGAALSGLSGMAYRRIMPVWDAAIPLVRPLLDLWREDIETYLGEMGWVAREDLTNQDTRYFRNHLRHDLIPELEGVNPKFKDVVRRMADVLGEEDRFLDALADQAWAACFREADEGSVVLGRREFLELEKALQRRVLRRAVGLLRPDLRDIGFEAIERGLAFAVEPTESGRMDLAARLNLVVLDERLLVKTWSAALPEDDLPLLPEVGYVGLLGEGGSLTLAYGWVLALDLLEMAPGLAVIEAQQLDPNEAWLDAATLRLPLSVRAKQEGERWQPLGLAGHSQKLSDFFVNEKIPQHLRDRWPLVCEEGDVAWVAGLRPAELFKLGPATTQIVRLRLQQTSQPD
jgi:tRNA(Ile)-lysidine synthase